MLITINDPELADDLCAHYTRSGFSVERISATRAEIVRDDAPTAEQGRREVELHLLVWKAVNPGANVRCTPVDRSFHARAVRSGLRLPRRTAL
jgi:hypothetical protein